MKERAAHQGDIQPQAGSLPPDGRPVRHRFVRHVLDNCWLLPLLHMLLLGGGMASIELIAMRVHFRMLFFLAFCLIWGSKGVALLLPVQLAILLFRERWRLALRLTLCSAIVLTPSAFYFRWVSRLPCPPDIAKRPVAVFVYVFFWLGMAALACLPLVGGIQLLRQRWKPALVTALISAVALPPFAWLIWKMSGLL